VPFLFCVKITQLLVHSAETHPCS